MSGSFLIFEEKKSPKWKEGYVRLNILQTRFHNFNIFFKLQFKMAEHIILGCCVILSCLL